RERDDPAAAAALDQVRGKGAADEVGAAQVRVDDEVEVLDRLLERRPRPVQAGRGDADRDVVAVGEPRGEAGDVPLGADVAGADVRLAAGGPDLAGDRLELLRRAREERHTRAGLGERERRGAPEPAAAAGDDRVPPVEPL